MIISNISNSSYSFQGKYKLFETKKAQEKRIKEEILKKQQEEKLKAEVAKKVAAERKEAKEKAICGIFTGLILAGLIDLVSCDNQASASSNNYDRHSRNDSYSEEEPQEQRIKITDKNGNSYYVTIEGEKPNNKNQREYSPLDDDFFEKFPNG